MAFFRSTGEQAERKSHIWKIFSFLFFFFYLTFSSFSFNSFSGWHKIILRSWTWYDTIKRNNKTTQKTNYVFCMILFRTWWFCRIQTTNKTEKNILEWKHRLVQHGTCIGSGCVRAFQQFRQTATIISWRITHILFLWSRAIYESKPSKDYVEITHYANIRTNDMKM